MQTQLSRRTFIQGVATTLIATMSGDIAFGAQPPLFFDRSVRPLGLQLYTLGDQTGADLDATFARVAEIGYRDIELPGFYGKPPAELKAAADRAGLFISSVHLLASPYPGTEQLTLQSDPRQIAQSLGELGVHQVVMPIAPFPPGLRREESGGDFMAALVRSYVEAGEDFWKQTAALLNERATALKPLGIALGYHNHNIEFAPIGPTSGWEILAGETDTELVQFEIDTGWLGASGIDPVAFLKQYGSRVRWLHLKDLKPTTTANYALSMDPVEVGAGKLDWPGILAAADAAGVKHFYVEQEPPFDRPRTEAIALSYRYLSRLRLGQGA